MQYVTNKTYTVGKNGKINEIVSTREYKKYGASAEFKIIMVKNNEMAGTYTFNYAPCLEGCEISAFTNKPIPIRQKIMNPGIVPYEGVEKNVMEDFIRRCAQDLIIAMKN